jgi:hypothetical protein
VCAPLLALTCGRTIGPGFLAEGFAGAAGFAETGEERVGRRVVSSDLAALIPPFLVCAAFLVAVGAFLRHEMRGGKNLADDEDDDLSTQDSAEPEQDNPTDPPEASHYGRSTESGDGRLDGL